MEKVTLCEAKGKLLEIGIFSISASFPWKCL